MPQNNPKKVWPFTGTCPSCDEHVDNNSNCVCGVRFRYDGTYFWPSNKARKASVSSKQNNQQINKENLNYDKKSQKKASFVVESQKSQKPDQSQEKASIESQKKGGEKGPDSGEKGTGKKDGILRRGASWIWKEIINI